MITGRWALRLQIFGLALTAALVAYTVYLYFQLGICPHGCL